MVGYRQHVGRLSMIFRCSKSFSVSAVSILKQQLSCLIRRQLANAKSSELFRRFPARAKVTLNRVIRDTWSVGEKARDSCKEFNLVVNRELIASPGVRSFWVYFGCCNFLCISKTKTFPGVKFCNKFSLSYLEIIVKGQLFRISGSQFFKWLWFGLWCVNHE